ncbi:hypothetical protein [Hyphomicrobium sp. DY-1]|uniref:hypothetical protein n=1 Tax=Hyphomicrobium sp. DY-1 TaxID=3075650 RepID=UPI0039C3920D
MPTPTPPTLLDKPDLYQDIFNRMEAVLTRIDKEFPELDGDEDLSGADAVDRIIEIRAEAKDALARLARISKGDAP